MKAVFLARNVIPGPGKTRVILVDVNGGVGNSDFRAGGNNGDIPIDFWGNAPDITPGQAYQLEITPYVSPDPDFNADKLTDTSTAQPEDENNVVEFNGKITLTKNDNGFSLVMVENDDDDETTTATIEGSAATNTQDNAAVLSDTAVGANAATGTIAPVDGTVLPDTSTTGSAPADMVSAPDGQALPGAGSPDAAGATGTTDQSTDQPGSDSQIQDNAANPAPDTQANPGASTGDNKEAGNMDTNTGQGV